MPDQPADLPAPDLPQAVGRPALAALADAGIRALADVAAWTERDLLALHGIGPKAIRVLREELAARGRAFRNTER